MRENMSERDRGRGKEGKKEREINKKKDENEG